MVSVGPGSGDSNPSPSSFKILYVLRVGFSTDWLGFLGLVWDEQVGDGPLGFPLVLWIPNGTVQAASENFGQQLGSLLLSVTCGSSLATVVATHRSCV